MLLTFFDLRLLKMTTNLEESNGFCQNQSKIMLSHRFPEERMVFAILKLTKT
jgi:hypothetical protein